ncbi:MAG: hypothetical protein H8E61_04105 [Bacteroidetes bacterium]|nr:hypothetical protein [Bacteroidota bacterium]
MKTILIIGSIIVTLALTCYSIGIITEQIKNKISKFVLVFLSLGILLDITATCCMIIGSTNSPFTFHGSLGYSALLVMLIDILLIWKNVLNNGLNIILSKRLHLYSRFAYLWWVIAYITGSLIVILK